MSYLLIIFFIFILINLKLKQLNKKHIKIKTKSLYFLAKPQKKVFTKSQMLLNYFKIEDLKKFKSLAKLRNVDHILSCVLYNTPKTYGKSINKVVLKNAGIDVNLPVFVVKNPNKEIIRDLIVALKFKKFNIVFFTNQYLLDKKDKKLKIELNYISLDTKFCSLTLLNNIMLLNINTNCKFKVQNVVKGNIFEIKNNGKQLNCISKIQNNLHCDLFCNNNVNVEVYNFKNSGQYLIFEISNKTNNNQTVDIKLGDKLDDNHYAFNKIPNGLILFNILTTKKYFIICDNYVKIKYSQNRNNIVELPYYLISKHFHLTAFMKIKFIIYFGEKNINKNEFSNCIDNFISQINNIVKFKVSLENKKLEFMFNEYLPKRIVLEDIQYFKKLEENSFDCVYSMYKRKQISCFQFYIWLKEKFFGVLENESFIKINPICNTSFCIAYKYEKNIINIKIERKNSGNSYLQMGKVKYYNCLIIPKDKINKFDNLTLVI